MIINKIKSLTGKLCLKCSKMLYLLVKEREKKKMQLFRDIHKGQACVIVGNGPSLTGEDLDYINKLNLPSFATNTIYRVFPNTKWRPTYYAIDDRGMLRRTEVREHLGEEKANKYFFIRQNYIQYHSIKKYLKPEKMIFLNSDGNREYLKTPRFSYDVADVIYSIGTVTYFCIQLAVYMGFSKIYLIGIDHSYPVERDRNGNIIINGGKAHVGQESEKENAIAASVWEMEIAYKQVVIEMKKGRFSVYNATRGGKLELFHRVCLEDIQSNDVRSTLNE